MAENGARRIRLGMVGGGTGAFIGYVHRVASRIDGDYEGQIETEQELVVTADAKEDQLGHGDGHIEFGRGRERAGAGRVVAVGTFSVSSTAGHQGGSASDEAQDFQGTLHVNFPFGKREWLWRLKQMP